MNFFQKVIAWVKANFTWSNEDFLLVAAAITSLQNIHWDPNSTLFALSLGSGMKGLLSMFKITLGVPQLEDVCLFVGGLVTLIQIHFMVLNPETHQINPMFALTVGAMAKAAFGFYGIPWPFQAKKPVGQPSAPDQPPAPLADRIQAKPLDAPAERPVLNAGFKPVEDPIIERGPGFVKLKSGTILRVDEKK